MPRLNLFSIAPDRGFLDTLAAGLLAEVGGRATGSDFSALADTIVLLPTRRACSALRDAFLRASGGEPLVLPRMSPIGDVDEEEMILTGPAEADLLDIPPPIGSTDRLIALTHLVLKKTKADDGTPEQAVQLARELARLLDQVETEEIGFNRLSDLVAEEHAEHWVRTLKFLEILSEAWPDHLAQTGTMGQAARRSALLRAQARLWRETPPAGKVIAAGSTGSIPATSELLGVISSLPNGQVILPGLDRHLDDDSWALVGRDPTHPQHGLALLLESLGAVRNDVDEWPGANGVDPVPSVWHERIAIVAEAMRPAEASGAWQHLQPVADDAFVGVDLLEMPDDTAEARAVALALREVLETPDRTAALVTPDRGLARRVSSELARWGVQIDDSAGIPLVDTPPAVFLRLVADAVAANLSPVALLALLKHPLARLGQEPGLARAEARNLEALALRGPKPRGGIDGLRRALEARRRETDPAGELDEPHPRLLAIERAKHFVERLAEALSPFLSHFEMRETVAAGTLVDSHIAAAEALARGADTENDAELWAGESGEALGDILAELRQALRQSSMPDLMLPAAQYPAFLVEVLSAGTVRPRYGRHPRLSILGPLEARLVRADLLILGGLNEGVWPPSPTLDAWMSRPMRATFGLPPPERRIGLAAHDFTQSIAAPQVLLTRAVKSEGEPTVPSRWLERLAVVIRQLGLEGVLAAENARAADLRNWQAGLERHQRIEPVPAPAPCPPVAARPSRLSATRIETWRRDPYGIFARSILGLKPLEDLEADLTAADKGSIVHDALDRFLREHPKVAGDEALASLMRIGLETFGEDRLAYPAVRAFWWPRFERIARWFIEQQARRRGLVAVSHTEIDGTLTFRRRDGSDFTLTARADRIDVAPSGAYTIIDYKTGEPPRRTDIDKGYASQLPLEAAIAMGGGFEGLTAGDVAELAFWKLSGGAEAGAIRTIEAAGVADLAAQARDGVAALVSAFDDPSMPYRAIPRRDRAPRFNDYEHLARVREWAVQDEGASS